MYFPHNASDQSISVFFNGGMKSVPASNPNFEALTEHLALAEHDYSVVENLVDKPSVIARMSEGAVTVLGGTVYFKGQAVRTSLALRLLDVINAGGQANVWARFMDRVMSNPSERSRDNLYSFLDKFKAPLTEDGHFIAFKRVRDTYFDIHSNTMDNSPGNIVEMPRHHVNEDPDETCSHGLHVAATSYLGVFYSRCEGYRVIACKVDPADVVAVPSDYNDAKMRVCRYLVLGDAEESFYNNAEAEENTVTYFGTDAATGDVVDMAGLPICYNANDFAENWARVTPSHYAVGGYVTPTHGRVNVFSSDNKFIVGKILEVAVEKDGELIVVEWQGGATEVYLLEDGDVVQVKFIGTVEDEPNPCAHCQEPIEQHLFLCEECQEEQDAEEDEEEDQAYCGTCGNVPVYWEGEDCDECEQDDIDNWQQRVDDDHDRMEEADHREETGLTRSGIPVEDLPDTHETEMAFTRNGVTYSTSAIKTGIATNGQRGYSRITGIPRTTLQDWMTKIGD
jgi:hypothetical protein